MAVSINDKTDFYPDNNNGKQLVTPEFSVASSDTPSNFQTVKPSTPNYENLQKMILENCGILNFSPPLSSVSEQKRVTNNDESINNADLNDKDMQPLNKSRVQSSDNDGIMDKLENECNVDVPENINDLDKICLKRLNKNYVHELDIDDMQASDLEIDWDSDKPENISGLDNIYTQPLNNNGMRNNNINELKDESTNSNSSSPNPEVQITKAETSNRKKRGPKPQIKPFGEKKNIRNAQLRKAQAKIRRKQKGFEDLINPANVVHLLNEYVSNIPHTEHISDEEEDLAKKFAQFFLVYQPTTSIKLTGIILRILTIDNPSIDDSEKETKRLATLRKAQAKYRRQRKGKKSFINPSNIVRSLNEYFPNKTTQKILDEEKAIAKKFIEALKKGVLIDHRSNNKLEAKKSELMVLVTIPQPLADNLVWPE